MIYNKLDFNNIGIWLNVMQIIKSCDLINKFIVNQTKLLFNTDTLF